MITDPISDYLTRIRNGNMAGHRVVEIPSSNLKKEITKILFEQGYILSYKFEETKNNQGQNETFKIMEKRLFFYIMNPAMLLSWIFGLLLVHSIGLTSLFETWLQIKLILITLLTIYHFFLLKCLKGFDSDNNTHTSKFFRIINEIPTIILIIVIFLVVFKPL